ncbi:MAG: hypothetical protein ABI352_03930 [Candidatus Dormibacter sp.]
MAILQLRGNASFVLRVGYNDHKSVLAALTGEECSGPPVPIDVLVVEAHWTQRHRDLVEQAAHGRQLVVDYRVDQWVLPGSSALPRGRSTAYSVDEIHENAAGIVHDALAAQVDTIWTVSPGCHVDALGDDAWRTTLRLLDETTHQAGTVPTARLLGTPSALATPEAARSLLDHLLTRNVRRIMLTVGPLAPDSTDGENVLRLVRLFSEADIAVHLTNQGALGLAALAMGAQSYDAGPLGRSEAFDFEAQRLRATSKSPARAPAPRAYVAPLLASVKKDIVTKLFQLKALRGALDCDGPCCAIRMDGALVHPVTHFVVRRCAQVRSVLDLPGDMRVAQADTLFAEAENLHEAIRGVRQNDRSALDASDLATLNERMRDVHSARRQLHRVLESANWAAS